MEAGGDTVGQKLDAGALFVLQSKGALSLHRLKLTTPAGRSSSPFLFLHLSFLEHARALVGRARSVCVRLRPSISIIILLWSAD
jgi:hypothetical protein